MRPIHSLFILVLLAGLGACDPRQVDLLAPTPVEPGESSGSGLADDFLADAGAIELAVEPGVVIETSPAPGPAPIGIDADPAVLAAREAIPHHDPRFRDRYEEAMIHRENGDIPQAIDALRHAVFDAPDSSPAWYELGRAYIDVGQQTRGISCVQEAVRRNRDHAAGHRTLARYFLEAGEPERARVHTDRLAAVARDEPSTPHLRARVFLGLAMWTEAIAEARRAVALDPENVSAYNNLGFAALQVGRNDLALQYLEAATELPGIQPYMLNNLGVAYERQGRHTDALVAYARAATADPSYVKAVSNRVRMQEVVDREVADEVSRILAERAHGGGDADSTAEVLRPEPAGAETARP